MTQPSVFEDRTPEVIKAEILTALTESGVEIDTREGSYTNILLSQVAYALWQRSEPAVSAFKRIRHGRIPYPVYVPLALGRKPSVEIHIHLERFERGHVVV